MNLERLVTALVPDDVVQPGAKHLLFFFQAEDGIRDYKVTGVQTCALPICSAIQGNFTKYTAVAGTAELRDAIAQRHNVDFDSDYRREEVIASVGGKHALFNAIQVLVDHGDDVILPVPYWVSFKDILRYAGGNCVLLDSDEEQGFRVTADMVAALITPRTKAIILNSPSNPSGAVMSPEDMTEVIRLAHQRGIWVLSDEC